MLSMAGQLRWRVPLPTDPDQQGIAVQPLALGATAVFAENDAVYGLSAADGRRLWRWAGGQLIYGLWPWQGTVVVLSGQVSNDARLVGVDAATGAVKWALPLPRQGLYGSQALTGDGGLAMLTPDGSLEVADLATGRLRWSHQPGGPAPAPQPTPEPAAQQEGAAPPVAVGSVVAGAVSGRADGYDSRTGARLWTVTGLPQVLSLTAAAGLILVTNADFGSSLPTEVTALDPATGRVAWRINGGPPPSVVASGPAGILLSADSPDWVALLDPATGKVRWRVPAFLSQASQPGLPPGAAVTARDTFAAEGQPGGTGSGSRLVARSASTGSVRWAVPLPASDPDGAAPFIAGSQVLVVTNPPAGGSATLKALDQATGHLAWQARMPTTMWVQPAAAGPGLLAQPTDASYVCAKDWVAGGGDAARMSSVPSRVRA
jgi:outer membrane protein assembly factor BamB